MKKTDRVEKTNIANIIFEIVFNMLSFVITRSGVRTHADMCLWFIESNL